MRVIKRYANRKLYDTTGSRYITLEQIATMLKDGEEIQIIDNKTKEDLTAVTMAQILVEEEKKERRGGPLPALRELLSRRIGEPVNSIRTGVEEKVTRLIRSGEERAAETREQVQSWIDQNTAAFEELQRRVDDRVRVVVNSLDIVGRFQSEITGLRERLEKVEAELGIEPVVEPESAEEDEVEPGA